MRRASQAKRRRKGTGAPGPGVRAQEPGRHGRRVSPLGGADRWRPPDFLL